MSSKSFLILTLFIAISKLEALICYEKNLGGEGVKTSDKIAACLSFFHAESRVASFGWKMSKITEKLNKESQNKEKYCEQVIDNTLGEEGILCLCFTNFCNTPITFDEFESQKVSLKKIE
ncbi:DUF19 domain-containing protein [Caenorhabditis elegans]|uniref:DUF19 domain-containing protein n=1 Tax=Caenorhabditis elegans TaxID=6239 RepID=Q22956_CAEEL|nr:DUF19 domain-containing protein [Caenorhabditis elegans]CCD62810.1 DUF19 domain-containing protein [Caenorhabditis elegans]|eukprot:NP_504866.1 Uncharacterized protein CELE_F10G2.2 [Caenorhabditis elegans]